MGKKRKLLWIVGALVVAVALFAAVTFVVDYNSADAKVERAVAQIVEEYGFELQNQLPGYIGAALTGKWYSRAPVSAGFEDEIVAILRAEIPSYEYERGVYGVHNLPRTGSPGDPSMVEHVFLPTDPLGGVPDGIVFSPDNKGNGRPGVDPTADLVVFKMERPGLWQRIKRMWPW